MIHAYRTGLTPNPDVECNRHIKFGLFYERAMRSGADFIATGHYARIVKHGGRYSLRTAVDSNKDQTYFLWGIDTKQLPRILFPVGTLRKPEVRRLAAAAHIHTATKKDSQGVCFVGPMNMKSFLRTYIAPKKGYIVHVDGRALGSHDGAGYYTVGQRHGLDIKEGGGPYYVVRKNMRTNEITVGPSDALLSDTARIESANWLGPIPKAGASLKAKIRHRAPSVAVSKRGSALRFRTPVQALAAGQSVVFYEGSRVVGGAIVR